MIEKQYLNTPEYIIRTFVSGNCRTVVPCSSICEGDAYTLRFDTEKLIPCENALTYDNAKLFSSHKKLAHMLIKLTEALYTFRSYCIPEEYITPEKDKLFLDYGGGDLFLIPEYCEKEWIDKLIDFCEDAERLIPDTQGFVLSEKLKEEKAAGRTDMRRLQALLHSLEFNLS